MQATVHPTGTDASAPADQKKRPVRLLVPTERRSDYWLSLEDTLRASDLGITRHTTDRQLHRMAAAADVTGAHYLDSLVRLRDGLRHPRDIDEARAWGFHVPRTKEENEQEFDPNPNKRLGWWWVYDPTRTETREQRAARYLADHRLIDMKGYARVWCRAYITVKDRKFEGDNIRKVLNNTEYRQQLAATIADQNPNVTAEQAEQALLAEANTGILKAMPPRRDRAGQSDLWYVSDAISSGRKLGRLDQWYEFNRVKQTGRPLGSKTKTRHTTPG